MSLVARWFLRLTGWEVEGTRPRESHYVLIAAPHTSNWDFVYMMAMAFLLKVRISWIGKHGLFRPPFGWVFRKLGGIPKVRDRRENFVDAMARAFAEAESLVLVVPAEGTRRRVDHWRSGFYHIARAARVPIVPGYLDYARRRGGFGTPIHVSGNVRRDMDKLRAHYAGIKGKYPERFGEVRLKEESSEPLADTGSG